LVGAELMPTENTGRHLRLRMNEQQLDIDALDAQVKALAEQVDATNAAIVEWAADTEVLKGKIEFLEAQIAAGEPVDLSALKADVEALSGKIAAAKGSAESGAALS